MKSFLLLIFALLLLSSFGKNDKKKCKILSKIIHSNIDKNPEIKVMKQIKYLFNQTHLIPCWNSNSSINFDLPNYTNYSLNKSLFKLDLIRLLQYFNCSKTEIQYLKNIKGGQFNRVEYLIINNRLKTPFIEMQDSIYIAEIDSFYNYKKFIDYKNVKGYNHNRDFFIDTLMLE